MIKSQDLRGVELLPHPAYSPDLAPSDYHLFRTIDHFLRARNFENIEVVEVGLTEFFAKKETRIKTLLQDQSRVDICRQLIGNPMDNRFVRRIVTCDEK